MAVLEIARFRLRDGVAAGEFLVQNLRVELDRLDFVPDHPCDILCAIAINVRENDAINSIGVREIVRKCAAPRTRRCGPWC